jgi:hypothetical protein
LLLGRSIENTKSKFLAAFATIILTNFIAFVIFLHFFDLS